MAADRQNWWFAAAWALLVLVVAAGFWIQAQTIGDLHETQDKLRAVTVRQALLIKGLETGFDQRQQELCTLLLSIVEKIEEPTGLDLTDEVVRSFTEVGIDCRTPVEPGG